MSGNEQEPPELPPWRMFALRNIYNALREIAQLVLACQGAIIDALIGVHAEIPSSVMPG
jgi:hypothetical protein